MDIVKAKFAWVLVPVCLVQASLKKKKNAMWKGFTGKKNLYLKNVVSQTALNTTAS